MTKYTATIAHHSIARARVLEIEGTLAQAKRAASREFGDGFADHRIVIRQADGRWDDIVATRRLSDRRWTDCHRR